MHPHIIYNYIFFVARSPHTLTSPSLIQCITLTQHVIAILLLFNLLTNISSSLLQSLGTNSLAAKYTATLWALSGSIHLVDGIKTYEKNQEFPEM